MAVVLADAPATGAAVWAIPGRATRALVDLDAIATNVGAVRRAVGPGTAVMAVVKADGYGHGAVMVARAAVAAGAARLGVATIEEGGALRRAGLTDPILVLGPSVGGDLDAAVRHRLALAVAGADEIEAVAAAARRAGPGAAVPVELHLKIDTGMRRYGAAPEDAADLARAAATRPGTALAGVFTHFADADGPDDAFTRVQAGRFEAVLARLATEGLRPPLAHAANSAATLHPAGDRFHYDLVRLGIALYGLSPSGGRALPRPMRPALEVRSRVARVFDLGPGESVGYGRTYRATGPERAALLPVGYGDGLPRALSNRGWVGLTGTRSPVLGRVCMDQTVVGVPEGRAVAVGDEAVLLARREDDGPTAAELAGLTGTIAYEIVCGLSARVPRFYLRDDRVVAVGDGDGLRTLEPDRPDGGAGGIRRTSV